MELLKIEDMNSYYDMSHVLHDVSLHVNEGEIVALLGRNGAGKTTTLRSIMGIIKRTGSIMFEGQETINKENDKIAKSGISYVPEDRRTFSSLTVEENLRLGHLGQDLGDVGEQYDLVYELFPNLSSMSNRPARNMSGGEQQMLAIGRGLMSDPKLLLVDEPTEGLMPSLVEDLSDALQRINSEGVTVILVEQNAELALSISDRTYILDEGQILQSETSKRIRENERLKKKYLSF